MFALKKEKKGKEKEWKNEIECLNNYDINDKKCSLFMTLS